MSVEISYSNDLLATQLADLPPGTTYLVGVIIFRPATISTSTSKPQILLVRRSPDEDSFPNIWEIPGGHVEPGETVLQSLQRETFEETGLVIEKVVGEVARMEWELEKSGEKKVKFNYAVPVQEPNHILLNPEEHTEWMWVGEEQIEGLALTSEMEKVVRDALAFSEMNE